MSKLVMRWLWFGAVLGCGQGDGRRDAATMCDGRRDAATMSTADAVADAPESGAALGSTQIGIGRRHDPMWVSQLGGCGNDVAESLAVSPGGVYLGGSTTSAWFRPFTDPCSAAGDHAGEDCGDAFVMNATTGAGTQFGERQSDGVKGLVVTSDGVYAAGKNREGAPRYSNDGFVARFSLDLTSRAWQVVLRNSGRVDEFLAIAAWGDLFAVGGSASQVGADPYAGDEDMFAMRITPGGMRGSVEQIGSTEFEEMMGVAVDADTVYAVGQTGGWVGSGAGRNRSTPDAFLVLMDRSLDTAREVCRVQFSSTGKDVARSVAAFGGYVYVTGYTDERIYDACNQDDAPPSDSIRTDAFVAKFDRMCQPVWTRQFGTKASDAAAQVAVDGTHVYVVGHYGSTNPAHRGITPNTHAFLRAYDLDGVVTGEVLFDSSSPRRATIDVAYAVRVDGGYVYVTGSTDGVLGASGASHGGTDVFLARVPVGELDRRVVFSGSGCR